MNRLPDELLHCVFAALPHSAKIQYAKSHRRVYFGIAKQAGFHPWRLGMMYYSLADVSADDNVASVHFIRGIGPDSMRIITAGGMPVDPYMPVAADVTITGYNAHRAIASTTCATVLNIIRLFNSPHYTLAVMRKFPDIHFHVGVFMWSLPGQPNVVEFAAKQLIKIGPIRGHAYISIICRYSYMDAYLHIAE